MTSESEDNFTESLRIDNEPPTIFPSPASNDLEVPLASGTKQLEPWYIACRLYFCRKQHNIT